MPKRRKLYRNGDAMKGTISRAMVQFAMYLYEKHGGSVEKLPAQSIPKENRAELKGYHTGHFTLINQDENALPEQGLS